MLHLLYCYCVVSNIVVVTIYWSILHERAINGEIAKNAPNLGGRLCFMYIGHLFPGITCLANMVATKCVMKRGLCKELCVVGMLYLGQNYMTVRSTGKPVYFFLTFEDPI